ncbi:hypothetical protein [Klebsiella phage GADU21]|nr:hypothetical protein [Klebsiella phage GADU21]DAK05675.1 MAG TPA: hypothetical protein [Caudoviricetes sp.]
MTVQVRSSVSKLVANLLSGVCQPNSVLLPVYSKLLISQSR